VWDWEERAALVRDTGRASRKKQHANFEHERASMCMIVLTSVSGRVYNVCTEPIMCVTLIWVRGR
jgi:hypothetical protein